MTATPAVMQLAPTSWQGTYRLPANADPVAITLSFRDGKVRVALGPGHAYATTVRGTPRHFRAFGLTFDKNTVTQGALRGTYTLRPGLDRIVSALGVYRSAGGAGVAISEADGLTPFLVEFPSGATHGVGKSLTVGMRLGDTHGNGALAVDATGFTWKGTHYARVPLVQREVRIGADAATLTVPRSSHKVPAVVMVHGSGPRTRDEFDIFTAYLALNGIAVLADDKRGVGESQGTYPGDAANPSAFDILSRDAQVEARYLARLPQIARVGLFGDSQAGWIVPLAASREPAIRWAILNSGPTTTVGETDYWGQLAGESTSPPSGTRAQMLAAIRRQGSSGFDPRPYLRKLAIPILWMYGADDRNVPTELCLERLDALKAGHDYTSVVLPTAHTPLQLPTGLLSSLPQSPGFDARYFPSLAEWLRRERLL